MRLRLTFELHIALEEDGRIFPHFLLCVICDLQRNLVQAVSSVSLHRFYEGLEVSPLPVGEALLGQSVLLRILFLSQRLS